MNTTKIIATAMLIATASIANGQVLRYELTGDLVTQSGMDPLGLDNQSFNATITLFDLEPDEITEDRFSFNNEAGSLSFDNFEPMATSGFAIFRKEAPNFDVMDIGFNLQEGDFIFALRFDLGANGDHPIPPLYDGFSVLAESTFLHSQNGGTVYSILNPQLTVRSIPEPSFVLLLGATGLPLLHRKKRLKQRNNVVCE